MKRQVVLPRARIGFAGLTLALALMGLPVTAQASPIPYEGNISNGQTVSGSIDGTLCGICGANGIAGLDFWSFFATAGNVITITGTRLDSNLDPSFVLYRGTTTADASTTNGHSFFADGQSGLTFGGMLGLAFRDDEIDAPGPFGDPLLLSFAVPSTGLYTVVVGAASNNQAPASAYQLRVDNITGTAVPEPGSLVLLGLGLAAGVRRLRTRRGSRSSLAG